MIGIFRLHIAIFFKLFLLEITSACLQTHNIGFTTQLQPACIIAGHLSPPLTGQDAGIRAPTKQLCSFPVCKC